MSESVLAKPSSGEGLAVSLSDGVLSVTID